MDDIRPALPRKSKRFVSLFRQSIRDRGLSYATEKTYLHWVLRCVDPQTGVLRRHHRHYSAFQKALKPAIRRAGIQRRAGPHTFRHSFATRLIETGYDIKLVQSLLGHGDIRTTEIYLHVVRNRAGAIVSPVDTLSS